MAQACGDGVRRLDQRACQRLQLSHGHPVGRAGNAECGEGAAGMIEDRSAHTAYPGLVFFIVNCKALFADIDGVGGTVSLGVPAGP